MKPAPNALMIAMCGCSRRPSRPSRRNTTPVSPVAVSGLREDRTNSLPSLFSGMERFSEGDRVRVDIPDETDPDYELYHGRHGEVIELLDDDASEFTGDDRDSVIYRIQLDNGESVDFRWRDLRPL